VDGKLSGMLLGCTLQTKPEDIYRALVEATAYGTRKIIETFAEHHVPVHTLVISGGIAQKNSFIMQTYADITGKEIKIAGSSQNPALSSAIWGALAAGKERGGFDNLLDAVNVLANQQDTIYQPNPDATEIYDILYHEYEILHDYFGRGGNNVMKHLKKLVEKQKNKRTNSEE
jgi:L-ribulokinase